MKNSKDLPNTKEISDVKKRRKKKKVWWKTTLYILMMTVLTIVSLLLIFNKQVGYQITDYTVRHTSKIKGEKLEPTYDMSQVKPYSAEAAVQAATEAQTTGVRAAGQVSIPSVGINLPVYEGVNNVHLYLGAAETRPRSEIQPGQEGNYTMLRIISIIEALYSNRCLEQRSETKSTWLSTTKYMNILSSM